MYNTARLSSDEAGLRKMQATDDLALIACA
jgi:hypothetical protein